MVKERRYKIKDICNIFDISRATLLRWEREGLITRVSRDWRNWRLYSERNLNEIRRIIKRKRRPAAS